MNQIIPETPSTSVNVKATSSAFLSASVKELRSAKRGKRERLGVHRWHPYYAGYSEHFVEDILNIFAKPSDVIVDPWNGSGTTNLVAQRNGFNCIGIEINPVMAIHAAAKNAIVLTKQNELLEYAKEVTLVATLDVHQSTTSTDELSNYVDQKSLIVLKSLKAAIERISQHTHLHEGDIDSVTAFLYSSLFQVLRQLGSFKNSSNPTWITTKENYRIEASTDIYAMFLSTINSMLASIQEVFTHESFIGQSRSLIGDARQLKLDSGLYDLVVTSPPYCTRIDYAMSTKPEILLLTGDLHSFDKLRRNTMGAPVIVNKNIDIDPLWGDTCVSFLQAVKNHTSKAAVSYYLPNLVQYFRDAARALQEINRVLKVGGHGVIVVQSSYYKDVEIKLGEIYCEMGSSLGMKSHILRREVVKQHMAHINTKSRTYVDSKTYFEDVVVVSKE